MDTKHTQPVIVIIGVRQSGLQALADRLKGDTPTECIILSSCTEQRRRLQAVVSVFRCSNYYDRTEQTMYKFYAYFFGSYMHQNAIIVFNNIGMTDEAKERREREGADLTARAKEFYDILGVELPVFHLDVNPVEKDKKNQEALCVKLINGLAVIQPVDIPVSKTVTNAQSLLDASKAAVDILHTNLQQEED